MSQGGSHWFIHKRQKLRLTSHRQHVISECKARMMLQTPRATVSPLEPAACPPPSSRTPGRGPTLLHCTRLVHGLQCLLWLTEVGGQEGVPGPWGRTGEPGWLPPRPHRRGWCGGGEGAVLGLLWLLTCLTEVSCILTPTNKYRHDSQKPMAS